MIRPLAAVLLLLTAGCDIVDPPRPPAPSPTPTPVADRPVEVEEPVDDRTAAALSREFGLRGCGDVTRLREVRADGLRAESWRVRSGKTCFEDYVARAERFTILAHLDEPKAKRDALPWLCGTGRSEHDSACSTQRREPTLLIEQPIGSDFLLLRRITKESR